MTKEFDPLDTRAHEAATALDAQAQHVKQEQEKADLKYLMSLPQGRRFIWRLLEEAGVFRTSFSTDALEMAFREGCRNQGLKMMTATIEHCPGEYHKMTREQKSGPKRN